MKIACLSTADLERILADTEREAGTESPSAQALRDELESRRRLTLREKSAEQERSSVGEASK